MLEEFARRLREERIGLNLDQVAFAGLGGVKKNSQVNYEAGRTPPTVEYLYRLAGHGVDIGYVLTGNRSSGDLSFEQSLLFESFGKLSVREREAVMHLLQTLAGMTIPTAESSAPIRGAGQRQGPPSISLHERSRPFKGKQKGP